jgi:ketosteroid isomerase-like protein
LTLVRSRLPPSGSADMVELVKGDGLEFFAPPDLLTEDFEIEFVPAALDTPGAEGGIEGLREGWRRWLAPYESYIVTIQDLMDGGGDDVVQTVHVRAVTARDGVAVEHEPAAVYTVRDGKIARIRFFLSHEEAFAAAGK